MAHWFGSWISFCTSSLALAGNAQRARQLTVINSRVVLMTNSSAARRPASLVAEIRALFSVGTRPSLQQWKHSNAFCSPWPGCRTPDQSPRRARAFDATQERLRAAAEAGNTYVKFAQRNSA